MDLIARLESAAEGSRELDAEIWACLQGCTSPLEYEQVDHGGPAREAVICGSLAAWLDEIPHYTTSLDAALTLVPEGKAWDCGYYPGYDNTGHAEVFLGSGDPAFRAPAKTPALALCIASLRARGG